MCSLDRGHICVPVGREGVPLGVVLSIVATGVTAENEAAGDHAFRNPDLCIAEIKQRRACIALREQTITN